jgi:hypothetical protein
LPSAGAGLLADKYTVELEGNSRSSSALNTLQLQFAQFRKDSAAEAEQIEGRNAVLTETLTIKDKQIYDSENKRLALVQGRLSDADESAPARRLAAPS